MRAARFRENLKRDPRRQNAVTLTEDFKESLSVDLRYKWVLNFTHYKVLSIRDTSATRGLLLMGDSSSSSKSASRERLLSAETSYVSAPLAHAEDARNVQVFYDDEKQVQAGFSDNGGTQSGANAGNRDTASSLLGGQAYELLIGPIGGSKAQVLRASFGQILEDSRATVGQLETQQMKRFYDKVVEVAVNLSNSPADTIDESGDFELPAELQAEIQSSNVTENSRIAAFAENNMNYCKAVSDRSEGDIQHLHLEARTQRSRKVWHVVNEASETGVIFPDDGERLDAFLESDGRAAISQEKLQGFDQIMDEETKSFKGYHDLLLSRARRSDRSHDDRKRAAETFANSLPKASEKRNDLVRLLPMLRYAEDFYFNLVTQSALYTHSDNAKHGLDLLGEWSATQLEIVQVCHASFGAKLPHNSIPRNQKALMAIANILSNNKHSLNPFFATLDNRMSPAFVPFAKKPGLASEEEDSPDSMQWSHCCRSAAVLCGEESSQTDVAFCRDARRRCCAADAQGRLPVMESDIWNTRFRMLCNETCERSVFGAPPGQRQFDDGNVASMAVSVAPTVSTTTTPAASPAETSTIARNQCPLQFRLAALGTDYSQTSSGRVRGYSSWALKVRPAQVHVVCWFDFHGSNNSSDSNGEASSSPVFPLPAQISRAQRDSLDFLMQLIGHPSAGRNARRSSVDADMTMGTRSDASSDFLAEALMSDNFSVDGHSAVSGPWAAGTRQAVQRELFRAMSEDVQGSSGLKQLATSELQ